MIPPFSVPVYEPLPYALSGLSFTQLPLYTQRYLRNIAKSVSPHAPDVNSISVERSIISMGLFPSLLGNDMNLVDLRHEAIAMARDLERGIPPQASAQWHAAMEKWRLQKVFGTLLPERELIFNQFMIKFDALLWLDQEGRENYTPEDWQRYRDALLKPILDNTSKQLVALDKSFRNLPVNSGYNYRVPSLPYLPFGLSRRGRDASRARSWRSATRGTDSGEDWPRGRMLSRHS
ncbi:hypothetical protein EV702DRAFT_1101006 [Suillus placidus]|uniref:Uncharacterized protein n=1 Tax=Suillus placidus TaxID=48579 RepID=A0A9P7D365_9AGAM|nr:hypothetical protein EV702DRAFT_1101006 [Suillus placidus]